MSSPGALTVYRWELRKLRALRRTYLGLGVAALVPTIFLVAVASETRGGGPRDVAFGRYIHDTGLAIPLVLLLFGSIWLFPLVTALVAGDIFASEDHNGTLKTILTRSLDRAPIFAGKALAATTYAVLALLVAIVVATAGGSLVSGFKGLTTLSGTHVSAGEALGLIGASMLVYLMPLLSIGAIALLLSVVTRNSAASVVGALMTSIVLQLLTIIPGLGSIKPYLLTEQFSAWEGLLRQPIDWSPIGRCAWVCACYAVPALVAALLVFIRRDVTDG